MQLSSHLPQLGMESVRFQELVNQKKYNKLNMMREDRKVRLLEMRELGFLVGK